LLLPLLLSLEANTEEIVVIERLVRKIRIIGSDYQPISRIILCLVIGFTLLIIGIPDHQVRAQEGMSISVPTGLTYLILQPNTSGQTVISGTGSATSNVTFNITVTDSLADSKPPGTAGKMAEWDGSAYVSSGRTLTNAVKVWSDDGTYGTGVITLDGSAPDVLHGVPFGSNINLQLKATQDTVIGDEALFGGHMYRIVITFTISEHT
jgi:hypothetical protein